MVPRVRAADFRASPERPCVLTDAQAGWAARTRWRPRELLRSHAEMRWRIDERREHTVTLREYLGADADDVKLGVPTATPATLAEAIHSVTVECGDEGDAVAPYIFDSSAVSTFADDYCTLPTVSAGCLFAADPSPPTHRWMLIGAAGSGTPLHVDPLATSAWNALVHGTKLWALFPPKQPRGARHVDGERHVDDGPTDDDLLSASARLTPRQWFRSFLPLAMGGSGGPRWTGPDPHLILQRSGETVIVPSGWRHAVLNLDLCVGVTHNVAMPRHLPVILALAEGIAPAFARRAAARASDGVRRRRAGDSEDDSAVSDRRGDDSDAPSGARKPSKRARGSEHHEDK